MGDHRNTEVNEERNINETISWKPFLRQLLVCSGVWTSYFTHGLLVGAPTVFIPQIRREANSTEAISPDMASWLTSVTGFSGFPCVIIISIFARFFGRKISFVIACIDSFIAYLVFFCSSTVLQILISEIMQGLFSAAQVVVSLMILTEYTSPRYRGLFLNIKSATFYWGIWAANAFGTFFHWKKIALAGVLCAAYTVITVLTWPESPYWLATKERFEDCAASHRWLKGCDDESEKELKTLINGQKEYLKRHGNQKLTISRTFVRWYKDLTEEEFYKPLLISMLTGILSVFSGKLICAVYAIDIIKKITGSESTAYTGMLILDGITVTSMYVGCVIAKFLKRRTMLLVSSSIAVFFLFTISLYLYLVKISVISENKYVSLSLLVLFSISVSCGPLIMSISVYGELIPVRSRNLAVCITAVIAKLLFGITLKLAPYLFMTFGLHGTFFAFGLSSSLTIILLYKYLPETKDKTLQEISDSIRGVTLKKCSLEEGSNLLIPKNVSVMKN